MEKPFVNSKQIEKRLKFASEHLSWTIDNWKKVVWSDESLFEVGKLSKQTKVWQKKGEKYNPECLQPTFKSGRTLTMAFFNITKGPLVFLPPKQQTAKDFIENVCGPHLVPFLQNKDPEHQLIFMEDNTPVHTALASHNFRKEENIHKIEDWPPQSPDLNPIKNVWKVLKTNVQELYQPWSTEEMKATLQLVWDTLPEEILTNLVASMPRRIQAVIDAKGAPTKW
jgi:hypothetical protein